MATQPQFHYCVATHHWSWKRTHTIEVLKAGCATTPELPDEKKNDRLIEYAQKCLSGGVLLALQVGANVNHRMVRERERARAHARAREGARERASERASERARESARSLLGTFCAVCMCPARPGPAFVIIRGRVHKFVHLSAYAL